MNINNLELADIGHANGISTQLAEVLRNIETRSLNEAEKEAIITDAAYYYGLFLKALGVDWKNDPNSENTPKRVAKAYVNDLWKGRYEIFGEVTSFPSDGYDGIVLEKNIPLTSMCSHHHQTIQGLVHIGYIAGPKTQVIGLSKLNRVVEHFGRRGAIQEQLTVAIHNAINVLIPNNEGVIVVIQATHNCVGCRGVKHKGASMVTSKVSGSFADHNKTAKSEVFGMMNLNEK